MSSPLKLGAIILCGGHSRRMGQDKALLPFGDERMLQRVVRLVGQTAQPIVVVAAVGQELPELPPNVSIVRDQHPDRGPLEGICAGLAALENEAEAAFITSCDVPLLVPAVIERLAQRLGTADNIVPTDGKHHHVLTAVYRTSILPVVRKLLAEDRRRPFFLISECDSIIIHETEFRDIDPDLDTLANLNTPEDYEAALRKLGL